MPLPYSAQAILAKLTYMVAKDPAHALEHDWLIATALAVRDRIVDRWIDATRRTYRDGRKRVYYFSLEFLIGRLLFDALGNLGLTATAREALREFGVDLDRLRKLEPDAALGNGGLGRLAACFMESMATLGIPAHGYGIRYDHGIFRQVMKDGWQHELPEDWLSSGNPWEFERPEVTYMIGFGGTVDSIANGDERDALRLAAGRERQCDRLRHAARRLARPPRQYAAAVVGAGDGPAAPRGLQSRRPRRRAGRPRAAGGDLARALPERRNGCRPRAAAAAGVLLRLGVAAGPAAPAQGAARRARVARRPRVDPAERHASGDRGPRADAAPGRRARHAWELAWDITTSVFNYTNHTLLPEALETWPVALMERLLPRHMQIIYLINALHLDRLRAAGRTDDGFLSSISLIEEDHSRRVRMGHLAFLGSRRVNGVSALHTSSCGRRCSATCIRSIRTASSTRPTGSRSAAGCSRRTRG